MVRCHGGVVEVEDIKKFMGCRTSEEFGSIGGLIGGQKGKIEKKDGQWIWSGGSIDGERGWSRSQRRKMQSWWLEGKWEGDFPGDHVWDVSLMIG